MKLQDVILKAMAKKISWLEAAEIAGVTDRTLRRMRDRYREFGYTGCSTKGAGNEASTGFPCRRRRKFSGSIGKYIST